MIWAEDRLYLLPSTGWILTQEKQSSNIEVIKSRLTVYIAECVCENVRYRQMCIVFWYVYPSVIDAICIYLTPLLILHPSHTHTLAKSCFLATALACPLQNKSRWLVSFSVCQIDTNYRSSWQYHLVSVTVILLTVSVPRKPISVMHFVNYPAAFTPMSCEHLVSVGGVTSLSANYFQFET